jgi:hypothetical protein
MIFHRRNAMIMAKYPSKFFKQKKNPKDPHGTKFLDIITTGLETPFDGSAEASGTLFRAINAWAMGVKPTGYQTLLKGLTMENLIGVNGDEDNPKANER